MYGSALSNRGYRSANTCPALVKSEMGAPAEGVTPGTTDLTAGVGVTGTSTPDVGEGGGVSAVDVSGFLEGSVAGGSTGFRVV